MTFTRPSAAATLALLLAFVCGCAAQGTRTSAGDRTVISLEEIMTFAPNVTARDIITRLRPSWLHQRGSATLRGSSPVGVYVDRQPRTDIQMLDRLAAAELSEIRYLSAIDATTRFGTDHSSGAILISTRR